MRTVPLLGMLQALRNKDPIGVPNGWPAIVAAAYAPLAGMSKMEFRCLVLNKLQLEGQIKIDQGTSLTVCSGSSMPRRTTRATV